ncbi:hypothetical protein HN011_001333 [Eciton burchellii]|nr:hypothetical protein HN011_001333 [Eciton burchellii]
MIDRSEDASESETDADEDAVSASDETVTPERDVKYIGSWLHQSCQKQLSHKCLKFFFLLLNSIALVAGVIAILTSIWMLIDGNFMSRLNGQRLFAIILLLLAMFVSIIASIGIVGVMARRRHLTIFYVICQSVALCAIFVYMAMSLPFFDKILKNIRSDMINSMAKYQSTDWAMKAWDNTQRYLRCCGIKSAKDWWDYQMDIPQSCCAESAVECLYMTMDVAYKNGCLRSVILLIRSYIRATTISMLVMFPFLLIGLLLAVGLLRRAHEANHSSGDEVTQRHQEQTMTQNRFFETHPLNAPLSGEYNAAEDQECNGNRCCEVLCWPAEGSVWMPVNVEALLFRLSGGSRTPSESSDGSYISPFHRNARDGWPLLLSIMITNTGLDYSTALAALLALISDRGVQLDDRVRPRATWRVPFRALTSATRTRNVQKGSSPSRDTDRSSFWTAVCSLPRRRSIQEKPQGCPKLFDILWTSPGLEITSWLGKIGLNTRSS